MFIAGHLRVTDDYMKQLASAVETNHKNTDTSEEGLVWV